MPNFKITLINVGHSKATNILLTTKPSLEAAKVRAVKECKLHLRSHNIGLETINPTTYRVTAGFRDVGRVEIEQTSC